jgi:hypothetical protein
MAFLLKVILYGLIIFYVIRFFRRVLASLFGGGEERPDDSRNASRRHEGEVRIENNKNQRSRVAKDEGEYVDFEEID